MANINGSFPAEAKKVGSSVEIPFRISVCDDKKKVIANAEVDILLDGVILDDSKFKSGNSPKMSGTSPISDTLVLDEKEAKAGSTVKLKVEYNGSEYADRSFSVKVPGEKEEKSAAGSTAEIDSFGRDGQHRITVQCFDSKGRGVKRMVRLIESLRRGQATIIPSGYNPHEEETEDDGSLSITLDYFEEKTRQIQVIILGTRDKKTLVLDGPNKPCRPIVPGGFLANFFKS